MTTQSKQELRKFYCKWCSKLQSSVTYWFDPKGKPKVFCRFCGRILGEIKQGQLPATTKTKIKSGCSVCGRLCDYRSKRCWSCEVKRRYEKKQNPN